MDVYKNKTTSSKYFDATNAVSHYVWLCEMAFGCVRNMTPIFRLVDVLDVLSSMINNA